MYKGSAQRLGCSGLKLGPPIQFAWKQEAGGAFYSSPAIVQGTIYLGNSDHHVYAYDLQSGALKWKSLLPERIYGSSPQVEQGRIYIACVDGCIYALDANDGKELARYCVKKNTFFGAGPDILGSPLVEDGKLYFGSDNQTIYCMNLPGGETRWSFDTGNSVHDAAATVLGDFVYMGSTDGHFYALDKNNGKLAFKSADFEKINTSAMAFDGRIYFGAGDRALHCLDAVSGKEIWNFKTPKGIMSSPALSPDATRIVFGGSDGNLYCLDMSGTLIWKFKTEGAVLASPLVTGDTVWIGSYDSRFYALSLLDGSMQFSYKTGTGIFSSAAALDGKIVVGGRDGVLYCFDATSK